MGDIHDLTRRIARGDEGAFEQFYDRYSTQIFRLLLVIARGDEVAAEELHQRVMIKTAQKMPPLADEDQLWKWLSQVARNTWRDAVRKKLREARALRDLAQIPPPAAQTVDRAVALHQALESLSQTQRDLVTAFYLEDENQKTIAQRTGQTVKAIQCELARIRKKLRGLIERPRGATEPGKQTSHRGNNEQ